VLLDVLLNVPVCVDPVSIVAAASLLTSVMFLTATLRVRAWGSHARSHDFAMPSTETGFASAEESILIGEAFPSIVAFVSYTVLRCLPLALLSLVTIDTDAPVGIVTSELGVSGQARGTVLTRVAQPRHTLEWHVAGAVISSCFQDTWLVVDAVTYTGVCITVVLIVAIFCYCECSNSQDCQ